MAAEGSDEGLRGWEKAHQAASERTPGGWAFVAHGAVAFLLPVVGALAGALAAGPGETRRFVGLVVGLTAAAAVGIVAGRLLGSFRRPTEE